MLKKSLGQTFLSRRRMNSRVPAFRKYPRNVPSPAVLLPVSKMNHLACPLCSHGEFQDLASLVTNISSILVRAIQCPVCNEILTGLQNFAAHLLSHCFVTANNGLANSRGDQSELKNGVQKTIAIETTNDSAATSCILSNSGASTSMSLDHTSKKANTADTNEFVEYFHKSCQVDPQPDRSFHKVKRDVTKQFRTAKKSVNLQQDELAHLMRCNYTLPLTCNPDFTNLSNHLSVMERNQTSLRESSLSFNELTDSESGDCSQGSFRNLDVSQSDHRNSFVSFGQESNPPSTISEFSQFFAESPGSSHTNNFEIQHQIPTSSTRTEWSVNPKNRSSTAPYKVTCDKCGVHYESSDLLQLHSAFCHNRANTNMRCKLCKKSCDSGPQLLSHFEQEHPEKKHVCLRCGNAYKTRGSLIVHMKVIHHASQKSAGDHSNQEVKAVEQMKVWECETCHKSFTTKYFLKKHKRLHTGEAPFKCAQCDKTFTFQQSYHKHLLYHTNEKPHICQECGRAFREISTLHNHQRIHTGEKPFVCETCGKSFRQRVSYLVHRRIHTGVMPYACSACGKTFRYKVSHKSHKCASTQSPGEPVRKPSYGILQKLTNKNTKEDQVPEGVSADNVITTSHKETFSFEEILNETPNGGVDLLAIAMTNLENCLSPVNFS